MFLAALLVAAAIAGGATLCAILFKRKLFWRYLRAGLIAFASQVFVAVFVELLATSSLFLVGSAGFGLFITGCVFALSHAEADRDGPVMNGGSGFIVGLFILTLILVGSYVLWPYSTQEARKLEALAKVQIAPASQSNSSLAPEQLGLEVDQEEALEIARNSLAERVPEGWISLERSSYQRVSGQSRYVFEILSGKAAKKRELWELPSIGYAVVNATDPAISAEVHLFYGARWRMDGASELQEALYEQSPIWPIEFTNSFVLELDDTGHPYYVASLDQPTARFSGVAPTGAVVVDALTGASSRYKMAQLPAWIDHVYAASTVRDLLGGWGSRNGDLELANPSSAEVVEPVVTTDGPAWRSFMVGGNDGKLVKYIAVTNARTGITRLHVPPRDFSVEALARVEPTVSASSHPTPSAS